MKLVISRAPLQRGLRWAQRAFAVFGVSLLLYCGYVLIDTWTFQRAERIRFQGMLVNRSAAVPTGSIATPATGGLLGRMDIPRLGISVIVMEGTSRTTLRRAAGHISGTVLPGQQGNIGISGHRDTFFRPLRNIRKNDIITVTTLAGQYSYRVISTSIVRPSDVSVLAPDGNETLTLVTCYPFYFVGAAPDRFIVRAERIV
jgi:LPXTG-site transpeptidase (sortase) family protein